MIVQGHTLLVLLHLIAFAVGLGATLVADWIVVTTMMFGTIEQRRCQQLHDLSTVIAIGMLLLWLTGAVLVVTNAQANPATLYNQKLWAKIVIVIVLTLNAGLLHRVVLPAVCDRAGRAMFDFVWSRMAVLFTTAGTVSATSWLFAAYLGVGRELNGRVSLSLVLGYYAATLMLLWLAALSALSVHRGGRRVVERVRSGGRRSTRDGPEVGAFPLDPARPVR